MEPPALLTLFILLAATCLVVPVVSRFKLGSVPAYLLAGIMIGPFGLALIDTPASILHIAEFGVVMMLFLIGLELEPAKLWALRRSIIGLGGLQVTLTSLAFCAVGLALGFDGNSSLAVGMALALSSTALVLQSLQEKNLLHTPMGEASFSVLLFQDLAVIPILIVLPLLATGVALPPPTTTLWLDGFAPWLRAVLTIAAVTTLIFGGRYLSRHLFRAVARTKLREVFTATSLALIVGVTLLMGKLGLSPALGAFIAGVVLANSEYRHTLESDLQPFKGLLLGLFFISVGMGIDFKILTTAPFAVLGLVVGLVALKIIILYVLGRVFGLERAQSAGFAVALAQGGEFAFVLFQYAQGFKLFTPEQSGLLTIAVSLSMALTPLMMVFYTRYVVPLFMSALPQKEFDVIQEKNTVILAGFGRFGQIVGRFLMGQGVDVTILEKDPDQIDLLRKFGYQGYYGDPAREDLLRSAGAAHARLLIIAVDEPDSCLEIARLAKRAFPHLAIYARAYDRQHAYALHKLGIAYFKREMFDSALTLAQEAMVFLGRRESDMQYRAEQFRRHDEATLKKSFTFYENEKELVAFAKARREELENILKDDITEKKGATE